MEMVAGDKNAGVLDYLNRRRSVMADDLHAPGPSADEVKKILTAAGRVPDHGKMCPWYFLVFEGDARKEAGDIIAKAYQSDYPNERADKVQKEAERFMRAPLVLAVIARVRKGKNPIWEQILSAGAACMNAVLAANALGFGAQWLTEWYAYHEDVKSGFGLDARDHVAGFIYIGTAKDKPKDRDRPDLDLITTHWRPDCEINKGDEACDREKFGFAAEGFDFSKF